MSDLDTQLNQLETSGLVRIAQLNPELEYIFRHALVQDAVYESLLKQDRRKLHRMVGETLERAYPQRVEELAAMLGSHFALAEDSERALHYCLIAARSAERRYANQEAITHYTAALHLALAMGIAEPLPELYLGIGRALRLTGQFKEAVETYQQMSAQAESCGDLAMRLAALIELATVYATSTSVHNAERALQLCEEVLPLARDLHDRAAEAKVLWNMLLAHKFGGRGAVGLPFGEQALEIARQVGDRPLIANILNDLGSHGYLDTSQFQKGAAALYEARDLWYELGNPHMLTDSAASLAIIRWLLGDYDESLALAREAWRIGDSVQNHWGKAHSLWAVPLIYQDWGRFEDAITAAETCLALAESVGFVAGVLGASSALTSAYLYIGQFEHAMTAAQRSQQVIVAHLPAWAPWISASVGLAQMAMDHAADKWLELDKLADHIPAFDGSRLLLGEVWVAQAQMQYWLITNQPEHALALAEPINQRMAALEMVAFRLDMLVYQARALAALGRDDEAWQVFDEARGLCKARSIRRLEWQALAGLADLADRRGEADQAFALRQQAADVLRSIEQRLTRPEFRASFLALPQVSAILAAVES